MRILATVITGDVNDCSQSQKFVGRRPVLLQSVCPYTRCRCI